MLWRRKAEAIKAKVEEKGALIAQAAQSVGRGDFEKARASLEAGGIDLSTRSLGAGRVGALAIGAAAFGAFAIGAFAIGRLSVGRARIGEAEIGRLRIGRLEVDEIFAPAVAAYRGRRPFEVDDE